MSGMGQTDIDYAKQLQVTADALQARLADARALAGEWMHHCDKPRCPMKTAGRILMERLNGEFR